MHHNGGIPIRCKNYTKHVLHGNSSKYVWDDFIPFDELPTEFNPSRGFVSSANQHPISDNVDYYYLPGVYWPAHRASRINHLLNQLGLPDRRKDESCLLLAQHLSWFLHPFAHELYLQDELPEFLRHQRWQGVRKAEENL